MILTCHSNMVHIHTLNKYARPLSHSSCSCSWTKPRVNLTVLCVVARLRRPVSAVLWWGRLLQNSSVSQQQRSVLVCGSLRQWGDRFTHPRPSRLRWVDHWRGGKMSFSGFGFKRSRYLLSGVFTKRNCCVFHVAKFTLQTSHWCWPFN